jgi:hypothetical protein
MEPGLGPSDPSFAGLRRQVPVADNFGLETRFDGPGLGPLVPVYNLRPRSAGYNPSNPGPLTQKPHRSRAPCVPWTHPRPSTAASCVEILQQKTTTNNLTTCQLANLPKAPCKNQPVLLSAALHFCAWIPLVPSQEGINPFFVSCLISSLRRFILLCFFSNYVVFPTSVRFAAKATTAFSSSVVFLHSVNKKDPNPSSFLQ